MKKELISFVGAAILALAALFTLGRGQGPTVSAYRSWTAPYSDYDDSTSGPVDQYDLRWSISPIDSTNWDAANQVAGEPIPGEPGLKDSCLVTGLPSNRIIYYGIKSIDFSSEPGYEISPLSNIYAERSPDRKKPKKVEDLR